jgi:hypothetical protein
VGSDDTGCEAREAEALDLIQIARSARRDEPSASEGFVSRAHHLAERRCGGHAVQILEDDDSRRRHRFHEPLDLIGKSGVDIRFVGRLCAPERGRSCVSHDGRQARKAGFDASVHEPFVPRSHVEKLNDVQDRRCVETTQHAQPARIFSAQEKVSFGLARF